MSDSMISMLKRASRPFKQFEINIGNQPFTFYTRSLSALDADRLSKVFGEEFEKVASEMEAGSIDTAMLRRNLSRQSKEKLGKLIVSADHQDFLSEAATELDDKSFSDPAVVKLADKKSETRYSELLELDDETLLDQALERRAFVVASLKAADAQNVAFLFYSLYREPDVPVFESQETIVDTFSRDDIINLINAIYVALRGGQKLDPLETQPSKPAEKRTRSQKHSVEA
jgi:hypothetical protein